MTKILASVISFDFPERHARDFLESSRIFYDSTQIDQSLGGQGEDLVRKVNRTPWVISLVFDKKKLTSK